MTRTPQLWRTRTEACPQWRYFWYTPGSPFSPRLAAREITGSFRRRALQVVPAEPERLIPAGKVRIEHTDIPYYIEGRL